MKFFKRSSRKNAKVSLILLDWSVRESPHIIHYLRDQTISPDDIEIIYIEFYDRKFEGLRQYEDRIDIWVALEMPKDVYYAKHLMYNAGAILASGELVCICDLDALVRPSFIERMIRAFAEDSNVVLHIDQFRNLRRDYYPFNFPPLEVVAGDGCINDAGGVTAGIRDHEDPIHTRNYGSCFVAKRADVIAVGGADMHIDYVGHICGPYDLSFRLRNLGRRIVWAEDEFMYHTWHPGTDGGDNYLGPHDGRNFSTTAMGFLASGEVAPLAENAGIAYLRKNDANDLDAVLARLIEPLYLDHWRMPALIARASQLRLAAYRTPLGVRDGALRVSDRGTDQMLPLSPETLPQRVGAPGDQLLASIAAVFRCIDIATRLVASYVPKRARRVPAPDWARVWIISPLLVLAFPAILVLAGHFRQRMRLATGDFRDLTNPLLNLALVMRQLAAASSSRRLQVVHDSRVALAGLRLMRGLRLVPAFLSIPVKSGNALRAAVTAGEPARITLVPSGLYVQYHLDVPAITQLVQVVLV